MDLESIEGEVNKDQQYIACAVTVFKRIDNDKSTINKAFAGSVRE